MAQIVASVSGVVLGGVAEVVGSNLARGKIYTASIGSVDSLYPSVYIYTEGYSESTEPIDAVYILPLARFEPTTSATPPSTTPDTDATICATETSPKKDVQEALILTTTDAVHIVYWFFSMDGIYFVRK